MIATALLTIMMTLAFGTPRAENTQRSDFRERDEIKQTYELAPGARVEVSSIRGRVDIATSDTATAEVQIIRTARTRADLEYHKIEVEQTANGLVIKGVQESEERNRDNVQVNHRVILKLPRRIDLLVSSISGPIKVGDVDGYVNVTSISGPATIGNVGDKLHVGQISGSLEVGTVGSIAGVNSISGNLRLGQVNGVFELTSVSGTVNVTLASLNPHGFSINSVSGSVEIAFKSDINADFNATGVSGDVYLDLPNVTRENEAKSPNVRARIGSGGTPITISSVTGNIRLTRSL